MLLTDFRTNRNCPRIVGGRTFVPVRLVTETYGATVTWNGTTRTVSVELGDTEVRLTIGLKKALINYEEKALEAAPYIKAGRTMVPVRLISEAFGLSVYYDSQAKTISIKSKTTGVVPGITGNQILIGSFSVQTGPYAVVGIPFSHGMQSYFNMVNESASYGRKINLKVADDVNLPTP